MAEISYRRTVKVREYESITMEATVESDNLDFAELTKKLDAEIENHVAYLQSKYEGLSSDSSIIYEE